MDTNLRHKWLQRYVPIEPSLAWEAIRNKQGWEAIEALDSASVTNKNISIIECNDDCCMCARLAVEVDRNDSDLVNFIYIPQHDGKPVLFTLSTLRIKELSSVIASLK